jgi:thioredoxin reductase
LREKHLSGTHVHLVVVGAAGGGIFAALSAAASEVSMLETSQIRVLPPAALDIMRWQGDATITVKQLIAAQAADNVIEDVSSVMS